MWVVFCGRVSRKTRDTCNYAICAYSTFLRQNVAAVRYQSAELYVRRITFIFHSFAFPDSPADLESGSWFGIPFQFGDCGVAVSTHILFFFAKYRHRRFCDGWGRSPRRSEREESFLQTSWIFWNSICAKKKLPAFSKIKFQRRLFPRCGK